MTDTNYTLLVVDDQEDNRDLLTRRLQRQGYRVLTAANGPAALQTVAGEGVDLVLLDIMMPGMNGVEVLRFLRKEHTAVDLPVIMVTAKVDSEDVVESLEEGANDYVTKPIDFPIILARVQAHLRTSRAARAKRAPAPPASAPEKPREIGPGSVLMDKYRIDSVIGTGNFGTVYRARHLHLDTGVAVKVLQRGMAGDADALARFQREGISACRIRHPNAVLVMDFGVWEGVTFLVMELLNGHSLEEELALAGRLTLERAIEIALPICSVLAESHRAGIIHRDIKPANVFLHRAPQGEIVKVLDFGIAKLTDDTTQTMTGLVLGTPAYMAPERFQGAPYDGSSDVYSVGTMLYQMLSGRLPYVPRKPDPMELAAMKISTEAQPLREVNPEIPSEIERIVMRTIRRRPGERPGAAELEAQLAVGGGRSAEPHAADRTLSAPSASADDAAPRVTEAPTEVLPKATLDDGTTEEWLPDRPANEEPEKK
jgi:serine/threonine protein kinase/CheY-like chemotaxis protein